MADEKHSINLSLSQIHSGDEVFDFCCTPCDEKKRNKQATKYCVSCGEYFCGDCVANHNSFKALSGHVLVDPGTKSKSAKKTQAVPTKLCKIHQLKLVDMYCGKHDSVGCSVCINLDHKSCDDIHYIPEYVQTNFPSHQVRQINMELTKAIKEMETLKKLHDSLDDNLDKSKANLKKEIQNYRDDINQILDKIEATTLAEIDARYKDTRQKIDSTKYNIDDVHGELVAFNSEIESDRNNDSQKFVIAKLSQCMIKRGQELQSELPQDHARELKFTRNTDIITFLLGIVTLGMLTPPMVQDSTQSTVNTSFIGREATMKPQKHDLYKIVDRSEYYLQEQDDKEICDIWSSCILDNGDIMLVDYKNDKLKLVDGRTYSVRSSLALDTKQLSVCKVSSTEVAVCLYNKTVQFVSTCNKLVPTRSFSMEHYCRCMTVIKDKMFVCDKQTLYIYTLIGKTMKIVNCISKDIPGNGNDVFSSICDIAVSDDEKMIHVVDWYKGVITLNTDGNVVWRYSGTEFHTACGVCTDGAGNVIVCGYISYTVIQLGPGGQYIGQIVTSSDGVIYPRTLSYDRNSHKLIVGMKHSGIMKVFTVK